MRSPSQVNEDGYKRQLQLTVVVWASGEKFKGVSPTSLTDRLLAISPCLFVLPFFVSKFFKAFFSYGVTKHNGDPIVGEVFTCCWNIIKYQNLKNFKAVK